MKKSAFKRSIEEWEPASVPETASLTILREAVAGCTVCPLPKRATQTVFGEGRKNAALMLLGEQPGEQEDLSGKPFVSPAGQILNRALEEAGIDRNSVYVTNTVKHFKWEPRGKRRIHQKPSSRDIAACRPWLEAELRVVRPDVLVCLGSTAARALFGSSIRVTRERGRLLEFETGAAGRDDGASFVPPPTTGRKVAGPKIRPLRRRFASRRTNCLANQELSLTNYGLGEASVVRVVASALAPTFTFFASRLPSSFFQ